VAFREVRVVEVREVLRACLSRAGLRIAAERAGVDRKTAHRYVAAGQEAGLRRDGSEGQLTDELYRRGRRSGPTTRPSGHRQAWEDLAQWTKQITAWKAELQLTNIHGKLIRRGVNVPYRTAPLRRRTLRLRPAAEHAAGRGR
jgi:hypothetical protein